MANKIRTRLFFILFLILIVIFVVYQKLNNCSRLVCITFKDSDSFKLADIYEENSAVFRGLYLNKGTNLKARTEIKSHIEKEEAEVLTKSQITRMKALFENAVSPYPGEISDTIKCDTKFKPEIKTININGIYLTYFYGFLNERMTYGSCIDNQLVYKSLFTLFYCDNQKKLYQLEIIGENENISVDKTNLDKILNSIKCN